MNSYQEEKQKEDNNVEDEDICVKCGDGFRNEDRLCNVSTYYCIDDENAKNPLDTTIQHANKLNYKELVETLHKNKNDGIQTFIHTSCRTFLKNRARATKRSSTSSEECKIKRPSIRLNQQSFDFKKQCLYCGHDCVFDERRPDRNNFEEVRTKSTDIYYVTLEICQNRDDQLAKTVEARLHGVYDLVAAEARYHVSCRTNFENPLPIYSSPGRPISTQKMTLFNAACKKLENDTELYTIVEFYSMMKEFADDVYSIKMTQIKLKEKYGKSLTLLERDGKSNIILLDRVGELLGEKWYNLEKKDKCEESKRVVITAAKLIKNVIKNCENEINTYPSTDELICTDNSYVPKLLEVFICELIKSLKPLKQSSIAQALFAAIRPSSVMPLQFGLAVATDSHFSSSS